MQQRAGKIIFGTDAVIDSINYKKAKLVIITIDASEKTKKNIIYICDKNKVPYIVFGNKDDMSHAIGKTNKVVFAIKDKNLADGIKKIIYGGDAIG